MYTKHYLTRLHFHSNCLQHV